MAAAGVGDGGGTADQPNPIFGATPPEAGGATSAPRMPPAELEAFIQAGILQSRQDRTQEIAGTHLEEPVRALESRLPEIRERAKIYYRTNAAHLSHKAREKTPSESSGSSEAGMARGSSGEGSQASGSFESSSKESQALTQQVETADLNFYTLVNELAETYNAFGITRFSFSDWTALDSIDPANHDLSIEWSGEQLLNRVVDNTKFENEIDQLINQHRLEIFETFFHERYDPARFEEYRLEIPPSSNETHLRGKTPRRLRFVLGETPPLEIYFKPRDAHVDALIIQTFRRINELPAEVKSAAIELPVYSINCDILSDSSYSLWQVIEGNQFEGVPVDRAILTRYPLEARPLMTEKLNRLESITKALGISDLHYENVIMQADAVVPIDLESLQPGKATGLFMGDPDIIPISEAERDIVESTKRQLQEIPSRFLPIPTGDYTAGIRGFWFLETVSDKIVKAISETGEYQFVDKIGNILEGKENIEKKHKTLQKLLLQDFLHNDVPYLTLMRDMVYYDTHMGRIPIAKRRI